MPEIHANTNDFTICTFASNYFNKISVVSLITALLVVVVNPLRFKVLMGASLFSKSAVLATVEAYCGPMKLIVANDKFSQVCLEFVEYR